MPSRVLGLFAREPRAGQVKTRLAADSSPELAAEAARAFLHDLVDRMSAVEARRVLAFTPRAAEPAFADIVRGRFSLHAQADGDLGRRLAVFFREAFDAGAERVVVLGSDAPTVPVPFVEQAFEVLAGADVVLGPSADGGYYLVGTSRPVPELFDEISWGGSCVLGETVARLPDPACRLAVLPPWYDVDTLDDWRMLAGHVAALRRAGQDPGIPHTERLLARRG